MRHYLGIMMSPPQDSSAWSYTAFTQRVRQHMRRTSSAAAFPAPADALDDQLKKILQLRREAAYLYDAVKLYAGSLAKVNMNFFLSRELFL